MAYARFGSGGSQVYIYPSVYGEIVCCMCALSGEANFRTRSAAIGHLKEHQEAGHFVPRHVFDRLVAEIQTKGDKVRE